MTYRKIQSLLLLTTILVIAYSFYFEYAKGMQPCPLCLMQRLSAFLFGVFCMVGLSISVLRWAKINVLFQVIWASFGLFFSIRQLWLQTLPLEQTTACMPGLEMMMRYFSWNSVLKVLFWGSSDCSEVTWKLLGLSMSAWSALYFFTILIISGIIFFSIRRQYFELSK